MKIINSFLRIWFNLIISQFCKLQRQELEQLFNKFDQDRSNALDFDEVFQMFNKYGFFITREELVGFFEIVDLNRDFSLNLEEFKACMLDEKAKQVNRYYIYFYDQFFTQMMKNLIERTKSNNLDENENSKKKKPSPVMPLTFSKIINLMTYLNQREELKLKLEQQNVNIQNQIPNLRSLISLSSIIDINKKKQLNGKDARKKSLSEQNHIEVLRSELSKIKQSAVGKGIREVSEKLKKQSYQNDSTVTKQKLDSFRQLCYTNRILKQKKQEKSQKVWNIHRRTSSENENPLLKVFSLNKIREEKQIQSKLTNKEYINYLKLKLNSEFSSVQETHESPQQRYTKSNLLTSPKSIELIKKKNALLKTLNFPGFKLMKSSKSYKTFKQSFPIYSQPDSPKIKIKNQFGTSPLSTAYPEQQNY